MVFQAKEKIYLFSSRGVTLIRRRGKRCRMLDGERTRALAREGRDLAPTVQVGKNGVTPQVVRELSEQLKKRKLVKVKLLSGVLRGAERSAVLDGLALGCNAYLVETRGNTALYFKP